MFRSVMANIYIFVLLVYLFYASPFWQVYFGFFFLGFIFYCDCNCSEKGLWILFHGLKMEEAQGWRFTSQTPHM